MMVFSGHGVNDVYGSVIENCMNSAEAAVERLGAAASSTREIHPCIMELKHPRQRLVTAYGRPVNVAFALAEVLWILSGSREVPMPSFYNSQIAQYSDDGKVFNAAYGYRLKHEFDGVDQLEDVIRGLALDPTSRQAVMSIWSPYSDSAFLLMEGAEENYFWQRETKDRACNLISHAMIRDGRLDWLQVMRSNDALWGLPYNWMQWTHIMEYVAFRLDIPLGTYVQVSDSLHIYEHQYEDANAIYDFDIYEHLPDHAPCDFGDEDTLMHVQMCEALVRKMKGWDGAVDSEELGTFWHSCLMLWRAHAHYKDHEDEMAFALLAACPDKVYAAAQMRFYWHMRWHDATAHDYDSELAELWSPMVMAWIQGDMP